VERAYWDSSALIPLCLFQPTSAHTRSLLRELSIATWWASTIEIHSAVERLVRSGDLSPDARTASLARLNRLSNNWQEIGPSDAILDHAKSLLAKHPLRAADSLQLAAAMIWCKSRPARRNFICSDARLCQAASDDGFTVIQP
jgi:uncharacterized protein